MRSVPHGAFDRLGKLQTIPPWEDYLQSVPHGAFDRLGKLQTITLLSNPWDCSRCEVLYLGEWIGANGDKVKASVKSDIAEPDRVT
uniref:Variable lymphocyte receptor A cassette n=1 Tax=Petromyzon marinus TaxID=7757 RepID=S4R596_PETMA